MAVLVIHRPAMGGHAAVRLDLEIPARRAEISKWDAGGHGRLQQLLRQYPVVTVLGARQVGKTTLAHALAARVKRPATFFDLERRADRARLADPDLALASLRGIVVLVRFPYPAT